MMMEVLFSSETLADFQHTQRYISAVRTSNPTYVVIH
jgi:hypothetical protein